MKVASLTKTCLIKPIADSRAEAYILGLKTQKL
jgi:hypothetical protein